MDNMDISWLETVMKNQQKSDSISKIVDMHDELAVPKGENYCSIITRATLNILTVAGKKIKKKVIIKKIPEGAQANLVEEYGLFKKEIKAYTTILPHMENLMEENGYKDKLWCKFIGYNPYDVIILEDLSEKGYSVMNRKIMFDLEHSILAAKAIGCYHAMAKVLLNKSIFKTTDHGLYPLIHLENAIQINFITPMILTAEAVTTKWGPEWIEIGRKLTKITEGVEEKLKELIKIDETKFNVVNHGDCWSNNLMFKHGPNNEPIKVKFVDFQIPHYNSFAWDLTYFMFNSIIPKIRRENRTLIIKTYYESLKSNMLKYKMLDQEIPTLEQINQEMDRMNYFGMVLLFSFFPILSAEVSNTYDFTEDNGDESSENYNKDCFTSIKYINYIKDDLYDFVK